MMQRLLEDMGTAPSLLDSVPMVQAFPIKTPAVFRQSGQLFSSNRHLGPYGATYCPLSGVQLKCPCGNSGHAEHLIRGCH